MKLRYDGPRYTNNLGHVIKINPDGTYTKLGWKATVVANILLTVLMGIGFGYGWILSKEHHKDEDSYMDGYNNGLRDGEKLPRYAPSGVRIS